MINFKDVKENIINNVDKSIKPSGFILQTEIQQGFNFYRFIRKDIYGNEQYISMEFYKFSKSFMVEVMFKIKISALYNYLNNIIKTLGCDEFVSPRFEFALYSNIGSVMVNRNDNKRKDEEYSYYINQEQDLMVISELITNDIQDFIFPFFNHNTSVEKVDLLLNSNESYIYGRYFPLCVCYGLLAAKINENPNLSSLIIAYDKEMKEPGTDEYDMKLFNILLSDLSKESLPINDLKINFTEL